MTQSRKRPAVGMIFFTLIALSLAVYFTFAAVQGNYGLFHRIQVNAEVRVLQERFDQISSDVLAMENKTHRLSDDYLDLDLLDQQARDILGLTRSDEVIIR